MGLVKDYFLTVFFTESLVSDAGGWENSELTLRWKREPVWLCLGYFPYRAEMLTDMPSEVHGRSATSCRLLISPKWEGPDSHERRKSLFRVGVDDESDFSFLSLLERGVEQGKTQRILLAIK